MYTGYFSASETERCVFLHLRFSQRVILFSFFTLALSCKFERGDGTGGSEKKIGSQTGEECIQACIRYKKTKDSRVNGVTILQVCSFFSFLFLFPSRFIHKQF